MALLEVEGLVKIYGRRKVVNGVSFDVNAGEVVGLLGPERGRQDDQLPHGDRARSPRTTAQVTFNGEDVTGLPMYQRARRGMGYLSQEPSVFRKLSVEKNLLAILEALPQEPHPRPRADAVRALGAHQRRAQPVQARPRPEEQRGALLRRREAAARDRPLPGVRAAPHPARRTVRGGGPADDRGHPPQHPRTGRLGHRHPHHRPQRPRGVPHRRPRLPHHRRARW